MRINALGNTATDFASDDYIALDGTTNGSRKMSKSSLLNKTAQNAINGNIAKDFDNTIDYKSGAVIMRNVNELRLVTSDFTAGNYNDNKTQRVTIEDLVEFSKVYSTFGNLKLRLQGYDNQRRLVFQNDGNEADYRVVFPDGAWDITTATYGYLYVRAFDSNGNVLKIIYSTSNINDIVVGFAIDVHLPQNTAYWDIALRGKTDEIVKIIVGANLNSRLKDTEDIVNALNVNFNGVFGSKKTKLFNGYNASNASNVGFGNAPFVLASVCLQNCYITEIEADFTTTGVLNIGYCKIIPGVSPYPYSSSDIVYVEEIIVDSTGFSNIKLNKPFFVPEGGCIIIGKTTDTAKWKYGANGENKGFYSVNVNYVLSTNSLGVNVYGYKRSVYHGKKLSILGDSISTYSGYNPSGQNPYYPFGTVQDVNDTWWMKLKNATGMYVDVNNSWGGSRVTTTAEGWQPGSAGCGNRSEALGDSPDVIIVWIGINDFISGVGIGSWDGTTSVPVETNTLREAYAIMLNKITTKYKKSEIFVCTLTEAERVGSSGFPEINPSGNTIHQYNNAIKEIADIFGVRVLDLHSCGLTYQNMSVFNPDTLHPTKFGHSVIANYIIGQLDTNVVYRYPKE